MTSFVPSKSNDRSAQVENEHKDSESKLMKLNKQGLYWSGAEGQFNIKHQNLPKSVRSAIDAPGTKLGGGAHGSVSRIRCRDIPIARKNIIVHSSAQCKEGVERIRNEIKHARRLKGHRHIFRIIGACYKQLSHTEPRWSILTFPVANCNLEGFMRDCQHLAGCQKSSRHDTLQSVCGKLMNATGLELSSLPDHQSIDNDMSLLQELVKKTMGCIVEGLKHMHERTILQNDLKAANVLLRNGHVYIADSGSCHDRRGRANDPTETMPCSTPG